ncbi:MAG: V-type ATP synthase subunit D [Canidatus Methanoxibalbensis ujae]|nr:V-type ATP synthase subunit D [Candidatus Methanoxibalbensis ujae]RLG38230.1 MAG: V-type ATP synthase subunit D [Methanosarcinales archaeon]
MPERIEGVSPTRMELLRLRQREKLAENGEELLREKRDALVAELLDVVCEVRDARKEMEAKMKEAFTHLAIAKAMLGAEKVRNLSLSARPQEMRIEFAARSVMGVSIPIIEFRHLVRKTTERGYSITDSSSALDEAARCFEEAVEKILRLAEIEEAVRHLASEVEKTKRRVNALKYVVIPRLKETRRYIQMRLEEMERENFTRLKKIKAVIEKREAAGI